MGSDYLGLVTWLVFNRSCGYQANVPPSGTALLSLSLVPTNPKTKGPSTATRAGGGLAQFCASHSSPGFQPRIHRAGSTSDFVSSLHLCFPWWEASFLALHSPWGCPVHSCQGYSLPFRSAHCSRCPPPGSELPFNLCCPDLHPSFFSGISSLVLWGVHSRWV